MDYLAEAKEIIEDCGRCCSSWCYVYDGDIPPHNASIDSIPIRYVYVYDGDIPPHNASIDSIPIRYVYDGDIPPHNASIDSIPIRYVYAVVQWFLD